jgi:rhamnosyltransferase
MISKDLFYKTRVYLDIIGLLKAINFLLYRIFFLRTFWEKLIVKSISNTNELIEIFEDIKDQKKEISKNLVSVIIPVNNAMSHGIENLINSLKNQTHKNIEFIAVDSGSTDGTVKWLKNNNIKVIQINPKDFNHAYSRNTGASFAKGKYLLFTVDDAVFKNRNWIISAIGLLEKFNVDSISTLQTVDSKADSYANLLFNFLRSEQSASFGINISKSNNFSKYLFRFLPLLTKFRAISIDDTNHLVRAEVFRKIKFELETVEDIDFAIRLTNHGYNFLYTNLLSIVHYHEFPKSNIYNYAKRVYLDNYYFFHKNRYEYLPINNRDSFVLHSIFLHSAFIKIFKNTKIDFKYENFNKFRNLLMLEIRREIYSFNKDILNLFNSSEIDNETSFLYKKIFNDVLQSKDTKLVNTKYINFLVLKNHSLIRAIFNTQINVKNYSDLINIFNHLWINFMMTILSNKNRVKIKSTKYKFDNWEISSWK